MYLKRNWIIYLTFNILLTVALFDAFDWLI